MQPYRVILLQCREGDGMGEAVMFIPMRHDIDM